MRPGRENGRARRARWKACAHVSMGCDRAIEPLPTGSHCTLQWIDHVSWQNTTKRKWWQTRWSRPGDWSLLKSFSRSTLLGQLHRNHERWTPGISHTLTCCSRSRESSSRPHVPVSDSVQDSTAYRSLSTPILSQRRESSAPADTTWPKKKKFDHWRTNFVAWTCWMSLAQKIQITLGSWCTDMLGPIFFKRDRKDSTKLLLSDNAALIIVQRAIADMSHRAETNPDFNESES